MWFARSVPSRIHRKRVHPLASMHTLFSRQPQESQGNEPNPLREDLALPTTGWCYDTLVTRPENGELCGSPDRFRVGSIGSIRNECTRLQARTHFSPDIHKNHKVMNQTLWGLSENSLKNVTLTTLPLLNVYGNISMEVLNNTEILWTQVYLEIGQVHPLPGCWCLRQGGKDKRFIFTHLTQTDHGLHLHPSLDWEINAF